MLAQSKRTVHDYVSDRVFDGKRPVAGVRLAKLRAKKARKALKASKVSLMMRIFRSFTFRFIPSK